MAEVKEKIRQEDEAKKAKEAAAAAASKLGDGGGDAAAAKEAEAAAKKSALEAAMAATLAAYAPLPVAKEKDSAKDKAEVAQTQLKGMTVQKDGRVVFKDKKEAMEAFKNLLRDR